MKRMDFEEFYNRTQAISRARKIFIPFLTKRIDEAFSMYQELLAEQDRDVWLNTVTSGNRYPTFIDEHYERPHCPDCNGLLLLRVIRAPKGKQNVKGWKTQWVCSAKNMNGEWCGYEKYSTNDIETEMGELKKKKKEVIEIE